MDWERATEELQKPLERANVDTRQGGGGKQLSYIEGWWAIAEANRIFGHGGWDRETVELKLITEKPVGYFAKVRVRVGTVIRDGCGYGTDTRGDHEKALKEAETDATKRALMTFGWPFGLALYDKTQEHVSDGHTSPSVERGGGVAAGNGGNADIDLGHLVGTGPSRFASKSPYDKLKSEMMGNRDLDDLNQWWVESKAKREKDLNSEYRMFLFREMLKHGFDIAPGPDDLRMFLTSHGKELTELKARSVKEWEGIGDFYERAKAKHAAPVR